MSDSEGGMFTAAFLKVLVGTFVTLLLWRVQIGSVCTCPFCHSIFVSKEVAFWPAARGLNEGVVHGVYEDLIDVIVKLWPLVHKSFTVRPFLFQILG